MYSRQSEYVKCIVNRTRVDSSEKGTRMEKKRVAAYCRVSTASDMQDGSYETQTEYYRSLIQSNPSWELAGIYGDHGKSGRSVKKRDGLRKLLSDCEAGKIDLILVKSVSRFARNISECVKMVRKLSDLGVIIQFEKEGFSNNDIQSELVLGIMATIAEQESVSLAQNVMWSRQNRNRQGAPIEKQPYGYDKVMPGNHWKINEREAKIVRKAFYMACMGCRYPAIMAELNRMENDSGSSRQWNNTPVKYLLTNISYTGDVITNKTCIIETPEGRKSVINNGIVDQFYIEEHHEPIISHTVFDIVQELVNRHLLFQQRTIFTDEEEELKKRARQIAKSEFGETEVI